MDGRERESRKLSTFALTGWVMLVSFVNREYERAVCLEPDFEAWMRVLLLQPMSLQSKDGGGYFTGST